MPITCPPAVFAHHTAVAPGCTVVDVEAREKIERVVLVEPRKGRVVAHCQPLAVGRNGRLVTFTLKYRAIHPIYAGGEKPLMFHCYGRQA